MDRISDYTDITRYRLQHGRLSLTDYKQEVVRDYLISNYQIFDRQISDLSVRPNIYQRLDTKYDIRSGTEYSVIPIRYLSKISDVQIRNRTKTMIWQICTGIK